MVYFGGFFAKLGHFAGFLYLSLVLPFIYIPLLSVCLICMFKYKKRKIRRGRIYSTVEKNKKIYEEKNKKNKTKKKLGRMVAQIH